MISIILFGKSDSKNEHFSASLCYALKSYGSYQIIKMHCSLDNKMCVSIHSQNTKTPKFLILDYSLKQLSLNTANSIIVIMDNLSSDTFLTLNNNNTISIINENNPLGVNILKNTNSPVINCGMASNNTLNISSVDNSRTFISLQREIKTFNGSIIEPHDFPVTFKKPISTYPLLASCAILLVSDINSSNGYSF